ncbi:MAG: type II toxin-antitoxin system RelB/DinJ family antitoxin [Clostridia bacterium]|nr:type II toxin-antitoxin system RelB/DinJ family antitoxin [Clostridia bacterium]
MAKKTANVVARVDPATKFLAEGILENLGIPVSVVINALYKQIIFTRSIPFSMEFPEIKSVDDMTVDEIKNMFKEANEDVKSGRCYPAEVVFAELEQDLKNAEKLFDKINNKT